MTEKTKNYRIVFRECRNLIEEIIDRFLARESHVTEDDIIEVIDRKYSALPYDIQVLKKRGLSKKEIRSLLGVGELSYCKACNQLKYRVKPTEVSYA